MKSEYIFFYEYAQKRILDIYNYLKNRFSIKLLYSSSYFSYFKYSDFNDASIFFKDLNCVNNSLSIRTKMYECNNPYTISLWLYTGGDSGHHFYDFDISYDLLSSDDFIYDYIIDLINDYFQLYCQNDFGVQLSIFDF